MSTKPGPNTPCECGSGKKYKHCCGLEGADQDNAPKKTLVRGIIGGVCALGLLLIVVANANRNSTPTRSAPAPIKRTNLPAVPSTTDGSVEAGAVWSAEHNHWHQPPGAAPMGKVWSQDHGHWHSAPNPASGQPGQPGQQRPQFQPKPQPPGPAPAGKEWSVEHGHWHDATTPTPAPTSSSIPRVTAPQDPVAAPSESDEN